MSAQSSFIETISKQDFLANNPKQQLYTQLENDPGNLSVTPIRMNDLWGFQSMGEILFTMPGVVGPIRAVATMPKRYSSTHYEWSGEVLNSYDLPVGRVVFIRNEDKEFGQILLPNRRFLIRDLDAGTEDDQVLVEINQAALGGQECGTGEFGDPPDGPGNPQEQLPPPPPPPPSCQTVINILFLYTQEVIDSSATFDPVELANRGLLALEETLEKSGIPNTDITVVNAGVELLTSYTDNQNNGVVARDLLTQNLEAQHLRDSFDADLVVLYQTTDMFIVEPNGGLFDIAGIAYINDVDIINDTVDIEKAYSVIEASAPASTFVHEIGHLLGCRHLKTEDPHPYGNANRFCLVPTPGAPEGNCNVYKKTVMASTDPAGERVLRFSNPDISGAYQGKITGTDTTNNALMISLTACQVGDFGDRVGSGINQPPFVSFISGPSTVYYHPNDDFTWSSYYWNCGGTVTYRWEVSWDYQNTWSHLSFAATATVAGNEVPPTAPKGYLRLTATCLQTDSSFVDFFEVKNWSAWNLSVDNESRVEPIAGYSKNLNTEAEQAIFRVYPNPVTDVLNVNLAKRIDDPVSISLISLHGIRHLLYQGNSDYSNHQWSFPVAAFSAGYYTLEIQTSSNRFLSPLILSKR